MTAWCFERTDWVLFDSGPARPLVHVCRVAADSWYDAREHARGLLQADTPLDGCEDPQPPPLTWYEVPASQDQHVLSWDGHDNGRVPRRKLVVVQPRTAAKRSGSGRAR